MNVSGRFQGLGRRPVSLVLVASLLAVEVTSWAEAPAPRFEQDRFAVGFWYDPPADEAMERRYREIADANFTLVVGGFGATTPEQISRQLELCRRFDLRALVSVPGKKIAHLTTDTEALWGYLWGDEPSATAFPELAKAVEEARSVRPGKLMFINLFPNYAPPSALGTQTYEEHVARFVDEVKPDVLSMDHYPSFRPGEGDGRESYNACLSVLRREALRAGIPFWNFFNTMPFAHHSDPTEGQLRWQIYSSLAHGAKGVLWFCYYTPPGAEFPKGGAIIGRDDRPTRHYDHARRLNGELKSLGQTLMKLTSTRTMHMKPGSETTATQEGWAVRRLSGDPAPHCFVGEFRHEDGRRAVLLQNYSYSHTAWPTVEFDGETTSVVEISKVTGEEEPVRDDSPDMAGLQLSLDAGDGRLFLLPSGRAGMGAE